MTISLDPLGDGSVSDRNFQKLMSLVLDTGGRSVGIRFGTATATWTASATSATVTIPHGLGKIPGFVTYGSKNTPFEYATASVDATNISTVGYQTAGTVVTGTLTFYWVVLG